MYNDIEIQIHILEQEAYGAVLRALKAQSDALTWDKEELITNLRRELKVSDDEHREVLSKVNDDPLLHRIREWRKGGSGSGSSASFGTRSNLPLPVHDQYQSPTILASRKRPKASHSVPFGTPRQTLQPPLPIAMSTPHHSSFLPRRELSSGVVDRRPERLVISSSPLQYQHVSQGPGVYFSNEIVQGTFDPLIGRKVMKRWPSDSNFYEAIITEYNPTEGRHALVYNIDTPNETMEWVDLKEFPLEDIRWIGDNFGNSIRSENNAQMIEQSTVTGTRVLRLSLRDQHENEVRESHNGIVSNNPVVDEIEILHTDTLIEKVEKMINVSHPGALELEKAKKMLKDHEQALIDVISKLADACDIRNGDQGGYMQQKQSRGGPNGRISEISAG